MSKRFDPRLIAASLAVSAVALTGAAQAQQAQQGQQQGQQQTRQQEMQQQRQGGQQQMRQNRQQQAQQMPMEYRQIKGTIVDARRVPVRGSKQPATLVLLETEGGNRAVVDLGTERLGIRLRPGAELAVRGRPVMVGQQRVILQANAVSYEGKAYDVNRPAMMRSGGQRQAMARDGQGQQAQQGQQGQQGRSFDQQAFADMLFGRYDQNGNGVLTIAEWDRGVDRMFGEENANLDPAAFDRDGDGRITKSEFQQGVRRSNLFQQIDRDGNDRVTMREIRTAGNTGGNSGQAAANTGQAAPYDEVAVGLYNSFDRDNNARVTRNEWGAQADTYFDGDFFGDWDADDSGWLDENEFASGIYDEGLFGEWDRNADGVIEADEWEAAGYDSGGLFGSDAGWLGENDGLIGEDEGVL